jgi:hypothetical protein
MKKVRSPKTQRLRPQFVLRLTDVSILEVIRVAAVTVVKVEAVKEPVPSQRSTRRPDLFHIRSHRTYQHNS